MIAFDKVIEQVVKKKAVVILLEKSDEQGTNVATRYSAKLHKNGKHPFTIITLANI